METGTLGNSGRQKLLWGGNGQRGGPEFTPGRKIYIVDDSGAILIRIIWCLTGHVLIKLFDEK